MKRLYKGYRRRTTGAKASKGKQKKTRNISSESRKRDRTKKK